MSVELLRKKETEGWFKSKWRPALGWLFCIIIAFDFLVAPIFWTLVQVYYVGEITQQWSSMTLSEGGLFYLSMGAILAVTAWSRGREKIAGVAGDYYPPNPYGVSREMYHEEQYPYTQENGDDREI